MHAEAFEQQQFGTAGIEGVKQLRITCTTLRALTDGFVSETYFSSSLQRAFWRPSMPLAWYFGLVVSALVSINKVTLRRARLVLGWVTVSGLQHPVWENLCNQPSRSTQPGGPSMGRCNKY